MLKRVSLYASVVLLGLTCFSFVLLSSSGASAENAVVSDVLISIPVACTMTGTGMNSHNATINPGTYQAGIGSTTLKVLCNDANGFAIYAIGYTGQTYGTTTLVGANSNQTIATGTGTSGTSQWAMKLETNAGAAYAVSLDNGYGAYSLVPSSYTKVAHRDSATDIGTNATGAELSTTYAAFIASTQASDTYNGKVKYTMVHPSNETPPVEVACANNKICYNANTNIKEGTMGQHAGNANTEVTLLASNFSKNGYGFAGWNTKPDYSGTFYGPNETITVPSTASSGGTPLYAVWVKSSGTLQGWTGCSSLTKADEATDILSQSIRALTDQRDGQTYAIAKLADGNCWMIENLRLEADDSSDSTLAQGFGGVFTGLANAESPPWADNSTTANSLYSTDGSTTNTISGSNQSSRFPRYNNINISTRASSPTTGSNVNIYSYGNYYTWSAAMANTENLTSYSASEAVGTSLCPTGWRLPTGGNKARIEADDGNKFWNLIVDELNGGTQPANYSSSTTPYYTGSAEAGPVNKLIRKYPNNFLYSGSVSSGSVDSRGSIGVYWSSTANSSSSAYNLLFNNAYVYPGTPSYNRSYGRTIRCVGTFPELNS